MSEHADVISKVRAALGRSGPLTGAPVPPVIDEPIVRLVHSEFGLPDLFARMAEANRMSPEMIYVDQIGERVVAFLHERGVNRVALPVSPFLEKIGVVTALRGSGLEVASWEELTLDALYDFDAAVTDVYAAVAETGSLVVRASAGHGRALSLVPPLHVAVLQPKDFVPDLVDLFHRMNADGVASGTSIITGPSRTADIEMNMVFGVHGPTAVKVFVLQ